MADQKTAIVTGASSGLGLQIAKQLLAKGYKVVLVSRSLERLETAIASFVDHADESATAWALPLAQDLSTVKGCQDCIAEAVELLGSQLHVLVNNAGAYDAFKSIADQAPEIWQRTLDLNLSSAIHLSTAGRPHLGKTKGCIINMSSIAGRRPMYNSGPYCVSKAALDMFTQCCALEWAAQGIRVDSINPATVATNFHTASGMSQAAADSYYEAGKTAHPLGRIGTPADIAAMCLFLASAEQSGWITGQNFVLDGGRLMPVQTPAGLGAK